MQKVNVKYELQLDATVRNIQLTFMNTHIDYAGDKKGSNYSGKVSNIQADSMLKIYMFLAGATGNWKLQVWVRDLDEHQNECGDWRPLKGNNNGLFEGAIQTRNTLNNFYPIKKNEVPA
ncbi:hypothetical protein [Pedobacter metabolipauper]|uniref:Uncharacterized protein n=1 Tax=Pedobacter metabolipauper TaxID=425513 RepID=A0A4R6SY93_9SPHI|nr:hypothetical protein [Pedobacter metabolipauper]TDQ11376.1 hypothetical protein ATK78_0494 [Pedobacter metabolipauper]